MDLKQRGFTIVKCKVHIILSSVLKRVGELRVNTRIRPLEEFSIGKGYTSMEILSGKKLQSEIRLVLCLQKELLISCGKISSF